MKDISKRPDGGVIEQLNLTPEQWVGLLDKEGPWLPYCCGSISTARDVLADCLRQSGRFDKRDAVTIICEIAATIHPAEATDEKTVSADSAERR